ncbi:hypothetical protein SUGI_1144420 [Cryptomeria japonica]|nr:hypothetical protein SUGI_1144420 [Cryptomeria japonica]
MSNQKLWREKVFKVHDGFGVATHTIVGFVNGSISKPLSILEPSIVPKVVVITCFVIEDPPVGSSLEREDLYEGIGFEDLKSRMETRNVPLMGIYKKGSGSVVGDKGKRILGFTSLMTTPSIPEDEEEEEEMPRVDVVYENIENIPPLLKTYTKSPAKPKRKCGDESRAVGGRGSILMIHQQLRML